MKIKWRKKHYRKSTLAIENNHEKNNMFFYCNKRIFHVIPQLQQVFFVILFLFFGMRSNRNSCRKKKLILNVDLFAIFIKARGCEGRTFAHSFSHISNVSVIFFLFCLTLIKLFLQFLHFFFVGRAALNKMPAVGMEIQWEHLKQGFCVFFILILYFILL